MNLLFCTSALPIQVKILPGSRLATFLLRKRKENKRDLLHSVNTNENHYQFDVVLILLWADFVIIVVEIERG
ncbi:hypothetical protein B6J58_26245 [Klebsiella quasipneumoniae]|nr:hypothetical protein A6D87_10855 [Klebsiella quasipneumoniae]OVY26843.1 hypothetical protein BME69_25410 [Klebsiella quasipneumoniae subsp. quasipneumoniae]PLC71738.1 hypothetical protein B6I39_14495 [Klebsiella quasipneumoniae]PLJ01604.1 hypothetical protein B6J58_26245 [Klebsiella quasipneumoniae]PLL84072.1 hypothetical protein CWN76_06805 [Klebsiella quasipneumoniae]